MKFADGKLYVAELQLAAPLAPFGHSKLFEQIKSLMHDDLVRVAQEFELPTHGLLSTHSLMLMVAHHAQRLWYAEMGAVPENVERNYSEQRKKHEALVQDLIDGKENAMTKEKKAKKTKKEKTPKAERKPLLYKVLSSKIDAKLTKKMENKEAKVHDVILLQVLSGMNGDSTLAAIAGAVESTKRWETNGDLDVSVRFHLNKLEKLGLVKATEAA